MKNSSETTILSYVIFTINRNVKQIHFGHMLNCKLHTSKLSADRTLQSDVIFFHISALTAACQSAYQEVVLMLLERGASVEATNNRGMPPLLCAARAGRV